MTPSSKPEIQSASAEQIVTAFKRRGHFDTLRKLTLSSFQAGSEGEKLVAKLREVVRIEVEKDSSLLYKDRSKSSILVGGAVDRAGVLDNIKTERDVIFGDLQVQEKIKSIIIALLLELNHTEVPNGRKDS